MIGRFVSGAGADQYDPNMHRYVGHFAAAVVMVAAGCGGVESGGTQSADGPMSHEVTPPSSPNVLKIDVRSASRSGQEITLTLAGTYTGDKTTMWRATTVEARTSARTCTVTAETGFPEGSHPPGSTVTGTWSMFCGEGEVEVRVDPFGGLLDSDTSTLVTLR
ncbi:hypothetical protein [Actinomadura algeriensis]|uniref:Bacterial spore germination immunoglobulin-like domain-containing protein n=1 Tax=Actinomadura algeriensis TaxID=1679523 RepID=A0ABR9JPG4_9ACTN|nr:hypothetical protein [Actinomadura algeriensis]MBE1532450.1 hypothetical protein [Actinomadura algeriensis]